MKGIGASAGRTLRGALMCSVAALGMAASAAQAAPVTTPMATAGTGDPATPQADPTTPPASQTTASSDQLPDSGQIGDVVVTAQRRAESLQQVPLSVVAVSAAEIRNQDINDVSRLVQVVPGLRLGRSGASERPAIRGVYTEAIGLNSDPRIGFYVDEIYQSRPQQTTAALVDLERVEVQKGPQGTLFGRNSYGGNIAFTTAKPSDRVEGGLDVLGGNYDRVRVEGYYNQPITDGVALRIAGEFERHSGYLQSVVTPRADLQDKREFFGRATLRIAPNSAPGLEILLRGSYYRRNDHGFNSVNGKVIGVAVDPSLVTAPGGTLVYNGQSFTFPLAGNGTGGFNGLNPGTGTLFPYTNAFRDGVADVNGADVGIRLPGPYGSVYDATPSERLHQQQYSGTINFDISPAVRLRSITSYNEFRTVNGGDGDGGPVPLQYFVTGTRSKTFTQELQLQPADHSSPFQYTLGGFYLHETARDASSYYYLNRNYTTAGAAAAGQPVLYGGRGGFGAANGCQYSFTTPAACSLNYTTGNIFDSSSETAARTKSYAVYGQASYTIDQKLTLTLGARYTVDDKFYESVFQSSNNGTLFAGQYATAQGLPGSAGNYYAVNPFFSDNFANLTCGGFTAQPISTNQSNTPVATVPNYYYTLCGSRKFKFGTYRAALDYKLSPDNLLYASFSTGRHSGGFGAGTFAANNPGSFTTFDSEGVTAYEVGSKNQFFDRRLQLNVAAFYNRYTRLQAQGTQVVSINGMNQNVTTIFNTGSENAPGFEAQAIVKPVPALTLNASVNYLHARYEKYLSYVPPSFICFYLAGGCQGGTTSSNAPANYAIGGGYFPNAQTNPDIFVNTGTSGFQYAYYPQDRRVQNTPDWSGQFGASYAIDAGRAGTFTPQFATIWTGKYLLSGSAPNIEQRSYFKTDARIVWNSADSRFSAQAFVQNIENKATLGRITVAASGEIQGTYDDPRTYGFKLGVRF